jgi:hypothetical protein
VYPGHDAKTNAMLRSSEIKAEEAEMLAAMFGENGELPAKRLI